MIDLAIILAFIAYAVWTGFAARKDASLGPEEYFLAGRRMKGWKAGLSMAATQYAADTPLVVTGLIATAGVFALWRFWVYSIAFLLMGFLLAPAWRRAGILTDAELCERRYSGPLAEGLRYLKGVYFGTVINCVVLGMVLLAATRITEPFLTWNLWLGDGVMAPLAGVLEWIGTPLTANLDGDDVWLRSANNLLSILVIVIFTTLYSATGGLKSVMETDVVQVILAFIATGMYAWILVGEAGGLVGLPDKLAGLYGEVRAAEIMSFKPTEGAAAGFAVLSLLGIQWFAQANSDGTGYLAQRSMACASDQEARRAAVVFTYVQSVLRTLLWLPIVVSLMVLYPALDPVDTEAAVAARESLFVVGIKDHLPTGALGIMLVGLFAALASTVDTHLNWGAGYWTNDLYDRLWCQRIKQREPDKKELVWVARLANILILAVALFVMFNLSSIQTAWKTSLLLGAGMGVPLLLRWVWHRQTAAGELVPIVLSMILAPVLLSTMPSDDQDALRLCIMTLTTTAASVAASLFSSPVDRERLKSFYEQVQPPGFWGEVGDASVSRRALFRALVATFAASGSVFGLIVGLGHPALGLFEPIAIAGGLAFGVGLIPVWWRYGMKNT